jgi:hypothetical protein
MRYGMIKSLQERQKRCQTCPVLASLKGLPIFLRVEPSVKTLGYFQKTQQRTLNRNADREGLHATVSTAANVYCRASPGLATTHIGTRATGPWLQRNRDNHANQIPSHRAVATI